MADPAVEPVLIDNLDVPEDKTPQVVIKNKTNPFSDGSWSEGAPKPPEAGVPAADPPAPTPTPADPSPAPIVEDIWTKETGWKSVDEAKAAKARLEELEKAPKIEPPKLSDEAKKWLDVFNEGKEDDLFDYLQAKKQLARIERLDVTKPKDATEIIKLEMQYKNKELTQDDIDYLFEKRYSMPEKPEQAIDQSDADYEKELARWERQVKATEKGMIVDAKLAKPELAKYKTEIVLPEIKKADTPAAAPSQEDLDKMQKARDSYLQSLDKGYVGFKGYSVEAIDEEVKLPISYDITDSERKAYKESLQEFDGEDYLQKRWFDYDEKAGTVTPKIEQMMRDKYLLENSEKIFQKIANESAAKMKSFLIKQRHNIDLGGGDKNKTDILKPQKTNREAEVDYLWKNA